MKIGFGFDQLAAGTERYPVFAGFPDGSSHPATAEPMEILVTALTDAILGAAGLIGRNSFFDETHEDRDVTGLEVLSEIERQIHYSGFKLVNADITLTYPAIVNTSPDIKLIRENISGALFADPEQIAIKWNAFRDGTERYICHATVLLGPRDK